MIVTFETAKLAKEKGFDIECKLFYTTIDRPPMPYNISAKESLSDNTQYNSYILAPTQTPLQKWLRDVHLIDVIVSREGTIQTLREGFSVMIYSPETTIFPWELGRVHKIYEEALEVGLLEALKLIK